MASFGFAELRRVVSNPDVAIDLGTANTRLYASGRGLIVDEPSVVAIDADTGSVEAVGARAARLASDDSVRQVAPMQQGVVSDLEAATSLLTPLLRRARTRFSLFRPRVLVCAPTDAREDER